MATSVINRRAAASALGLFLVLSIVPPAVGQPAVAPPEPPSRAESPDEGTWHSLPVTGGRATLAALGVDDTRERSAVMVELIRRLHFSTNPPTELENALAKLASARGSSTTDAHALVLPLPLSPETWSSAVFQRDVPLSRLFVEILNDPAARLLFHGLAGLDPDTRRWFGGQRDLLSRLYRDQNANRAFALFAPSIRVVSGKVIVPGGVMAEQRWSSTLNAVPTQPALFVRRLFEHHNGRTAGLYFTIATANQPRQHFLLGATGARFEHLVAAFRDCYPANATAAYPFALRSHDAALLLIEVGLTADGALPGPTPRAFWERVLRGADLEDRSSPDSGLNGEPIDAAWMIETVCRASSPDRGPVFATLLAGQRTFAGLPEADLPDALVALRSRRLFPALFMALEHAGIKRARTYAAVARHAAQLARLDDPERAITALRQFQGLLTLTLNATTATTLSVDDADALLASLAEVRLEQERYDGKLVEWFEQHWLPAVWRSARADSAEETVARALAGPPEARPRRMQWEGLDYVVDFSAAGRQRLLEVRKRQGGVTIGTVLELNRIATAMKQPRLATSEITALKVNLRALGQDLGAFTPADEFAGDGPSVEEALASGNRLPRAIDFLFAHVIASWAYAPLVGDADSGALTGGDGSLRHVLGLRLIGRSKAERRWELPAAERGVVSGSLLGLESALGVWSLRRLSIDAVPAPPTIVGNDLTSLLLTTALSDPRRLTDEDAEQITKAIAGGAAAIEQARSDPSHLAVLAGTASISPWRREVLSWIIKEEPERLLEQFSLIEQARLGGLRIDTMGAWGTASIVTGCLCLRMPPGRIPEVIVGRAADGIVGGQSADLMLRVATLLTELKVPTSLASSVLAYAMRGFLDHVKPLHAADFEAFARQARALNRQAVEDYLGAIAAVGALRPVGAHP